MRSTTANDQVCWLLVHPHEISSVGCVGVGMALKLSELLAEVKSILLGEVPERTVPALGSGLGPAN